MSLEDSQVPGPLLCRLPTDCHEIITAHAPAMLCFTMQSKDTVMAEVLRTVLSCSHQAFGDSGEKLILDRRSRRITQSVLWRVYAVR